MFEDNISNDQCENILQDIGNITNQFLDTGDLDFQTGTISCSNKTPVDTNVPSTAIILPGEISASKDSSVVVAPSCNSTYSPSLSSFEEPTVKLVKNQSVAEQRKKNLKGMPLSILSYH